ncbi:MAG: DUF3999 domain-containing protein [Gallionella sp.]|nr:DUF3999 domain-containing protein [Gallionella sp.]
MRSLLVLLLLAVMQNTQADSIDDYRQLMPLVPAHEGGQHRLELPEDVYLYAERTDLLDLRIFNASRESLAYSLSDAPATLKAKPEPKTLNWFALPDNPAPDVNLTVALGPDGTLTASRHHNPPSQTVARHYLVDASGLDYAIEAMQIKTDDTQDNALRHLSIDGSDDLRTWHSVTEHAPWLSVHTGAVQLDQKRVEFPPVRYKYYRINWEDTPEPVRQILVDVTTDNLPVHYLQHLLRAAQSKPSSADYEFELPAALMPERLRLLLPQTDSIASVSIYTRRTQKDRWQTLTSAAFYRISRDNTELTSPAHPLPGTTARYWRIHVDKYSHELPSSLELALTWRPHQLVFLASGSAPYTLAFGNPHAKAAGFSLSTLLPGYRTGDELKLPQATTGARVSREPDPVLFTNRWSEIPWMQLMLWAILIAGVMVLAWMAWRIKKDLDNTRQD